MGMTTAYVACVAVFLMASGVAADSRWTYGSATFYGDMSGSETMAGACGYGDLFKQGYGLKSAALSTALFKNGLSCGACFQIQCVNNPRWCSSETITVTATNFCPPDYSKPNDNGGWCNPPRMHFDLSMLMFTKITKDYHAGIVPVKFRRVHCVKSGGIKFEIKGNPYWILVLIYNVGGPGEVLLVQVKGSKTGWTNMSRNWGQNWQTNQQLQGQSLSFRVLSDNKRLVESHHVAPANWQFGQVFEGKQF